MPRKPPAKPWTPHHDLIISVVSPSVAAEKLGRTEVEVLARRKELGLPELAPKNRWGKTRSIPWTAQVEELVRTLSVGEVVRRTKRTRSEVVNRRTALKKQGNL